MNGGNLYLYETTQIRPYVLLDSAKHTAECRDLFLLVLQIPKLAIVMRCYNLTVQVQAASEFAWKVSKSTCMCTTESVRFWADLIHNYLLSQLINIRDSVTTCRNSAVYLVCNLVPPNLYLVSWKRFRASSSKGNISQGSRVAYLGNASFACLANARCTINTVHSFMLLVSGPE